MTDAKGRHAVGESNFESKKLLRGGDYSLEGPWHSTHLKGVGL